MFCSNCIFARRSQMDLEDILHFKIGLLIQNK